MKKVLLLIMLLVGSFSLQAMDRKEIKTVNELKTADLADGFIISEAEDLRLLPVRDSKFLPLYPPCVFENTGGFSIESIYFSVLRNSWVWARSIGGVFGIHEISGEDALRICARNVKITGSDDI